MYWCKSNLEESEITGEVIILEKPDETEKDYPEFVKLTGRHDCYNIGDRIKFNAEIYWTCNERLHLDTNRIS